MSTAYEFEWDEYKAATNERKHGVSFELAMTVFLDPLAVTTHDDEHGATEERWATIGQAENGVTLVVSHTFTPQTTHYALVRLISARKATKRERRQYEEG